MAIKTNILVDQGASYATSIDVKDEDDNIILLTGYSANAQIRKTYTSSNAVSFGVSVQQSNGIIDLSLTANQTSSIIAGRYVYDVRVVSPGGVVSRIIEGIVTVNPAVTK